MSKTFSKILVICALVVTLPLLIIGTSFAAYYSISASVGVAIQFDGETTSSANAYARVVYNQTRHLEEFEITGSHVKTITLKAESKGYDFVGWYEGPLAEENLLGNEETVSVKLADIDNIIALFKTHTYSVSYYYKSNPTVDTYVESVPTGFGAEYKFGQTLPATSDFTHYDGHKIAGWDLLDSDHNVVDDNNGAHYTVAEFPEMESYTLGAVWTVDPAIAVTYKNGDTTLDTANGYETVGITVADANSYAAAAGITLNAGEKLVWKNGGTVVSGKVYQDMTLSLEKVDVVYTLTVTPSEDMQLADGVNGTVSFTKDDTSALETLFGDASWNNTYSFWTFDGVEIDSTKYSTVAEVLTAVETISANADASVNADAVLKKNFTAITFTTASYKTKPEGSNAYTAPVYGQLIAGQYTDRTINIEDTTTSVADWAFGTDPMDQEAYFSDEELQNELHLYAFSFNNYNVLVVEPLDYASWNDIIEEIYNADTMTLADTLTIATLEIRFN